MLALHLSPFYFNSNSHPYPLLVCAGCWEDAILAASYRTIPTVVTSNLFSKSREYQILCHHKYLAADVARIYDHDRFVEVHSTQEVGRNRDKRSECDLS